MAPMLAKMPSFALHDPLTVYYVLTSPDSSFAQLSLSASAGTTDPPRPRWISSASSPTCPEELEDVRVETLGQWTRGQTLVDRRPLSRNAQNSDQARPRPRRRSTGERPYDRGDWRGARAGNRVRVYVASGMEGSGLQDEQGTFAQTLLGRVFGRHLAVS